MGAERLGDAAAGLLLQALLFVAPGLALQGSIWLAGLAAAGGLLIVRQVGKGYIRALEESLKERALELNLMSLNEETARATLLRTASLHGMTTQFNQQQGFPTQSSRPGSPAEGMGGFAPDAVAQDPVMSLKWELRSGDPARVRRALRTPACVSAELVPQLVALLAWEEAIGWVTPVLQKLAPRVTGALLDHLLDPGEDFMVRRRIPSILASHPSRLGAQGLVLGLEDRRFEIRFQCVQSLLRMTAKLDWAIPPEQVFKFARSELKVDSRLWSSRRLPKREMRSAPLLRGLKSPPSDPSLLHLFSLFCLIFPEDAMRLSFQAFATHDDRLRGTAMEYHAAASPDAWGRSRGGAITSALPYLGWSTAAWRCGFLSEWRTRTARRHGPGRRCSTPDPAPGTAPLSGFPARVRMLRQPSGVAPRQYGACGPSLRQRVNYPGQRVVAGPGVRRFGLDVVCYRCATSEDPCGMTTLRASLAIKTHPELATGTSRTVH